MLSFVVNNKLKLSRLPIKVTKIGIGGLILATTALYSSAPVIAVPSSKERSLVVTDSDEVTSSQTSVGKTYQKRTRSGETLFSQLRRFQSSCWTAFLISFDYKWSLRGAHIDNPRYKEMCAEVHARSAYRLLKLCKKNAGIYVKAGQYVSSLNHILPLEYTSTLSELQDKAPAMPFEEVSQVFKNEFGKHPDQIFTYFDRVPVAAASLAQVHHAMLKDGREVAVKVQYLGLPTQVISDLKTFQYILKGISWAFPDFEFTWMVPEFERNLLKELDFVNEGQNAERVTKNFKHSKLKMPLKIPSIYWEWTTPRVLTMEFCHGVKVTDLPSLKKLKINVNQLGAMLTEMFSEQIFVHGFIHGDPHPGNILVGIKNKRPEVILLDHGLYRELSDDLRIHYCKLWKAIVLRDNKQVEIQARKLGAGEYSKLLHYSLTHRPEMETNVTISKEEQAKLHRELKSNHGIVTELMQNIPRDLLLVLRTQNLVRSINKELDAAVNRFVIMAEYSVQGINTTSKSNSLANQLIRWTEGIRFQLNLKIMDLMFHLMNMWLHVKYWVGLSENSHLT